MRRLETEILDRPVDDRSESESPAGLATAGVDSAGLAHDTDEPMTPKHPANVNATETKELRFAANLDRKSCRTLLVIVGSNSCISAVCA